MTADGACDTRRCRTASIDRHATAIIPIRKNERACNEDCPAGRSLLPSEHVLMALG